MALTAAAGALVSYAPAQPQLVKVGLVSLAGAALLLLAVRLPLSVLPLALVVGLLALGNLELSRIVGVPVLGGQEKWVLLILAGVAVLGAALDASAPRRPAWPAILLLGGLFLTVCTGSLFYAADRELAWVSVAHQVVQMAALAAGFFWIRRPREGEALVGCLAAVGAVSAGLGIWQFLTPVAFNNVFGGFTNLDMRFFMDYWAVDIGRVGALWGHAPPFAAFLSALLSAFLYVLLRRRSGLLALAAGAAFALAALALALTGTRMPLLGGAAGVAVFLAFWRRRRLSSRAGGFLVIALLVAAPLAAGVLSASRGADANVLARFASLFSEDGEVSVSISGRQAIYGTLLDAWRSEPWLGVGLGNTRPAIEEASTFNSTPHAYWLGLLAETGLVGVGLVALMLAAMSQHYHRLLRRAAASPEGAFGVFALAASTALLIGSLFDNAMLVWQIGVIFWLLQGAVLSLSLRSEERADIDAEERSMQEAANAR
jgi:O-antigen ligase